MSRIAITGATGMVGTALSDLLKANGDEVIPISRSNRAGTVPWNIDEQTLDPGALAGLDGVIHLAGSGIAEGRWTTERKREIRDSRVQSARLLVDSIAKLADRPKVFMTASGAGYYGSSHRGPVDEAAPQGTGFLADVCREWEGEARRAESLGLRVVIARLGVVLSPKGGALQKMLPPFKFGLGGPVGSGQQRLGWIALEDAAAALGFLARQADASGPYNLTAPEIVTNAQFAETLGRVLGKPAKLPVPAFALKLALGEMAEETVLADSPVLPKRLLESGFAFRFPELGGALRHVGHHNEKDLTAEHAESTEEEIGRIE